MHQIEYLTYTSRKSEKTILKECSVIADWEGDYKGQIKHIRFKDIVKNNYDEAYEWIRQNDNGWYDNLAVKYKDGRKVMWLVKIEFHC